VSHDDLQYLLGEWAAFRDFEKDEHQEIKNRLLRIEQKLDGINEDRFRIKGVIGVIGLLSGSIGGILIKHLLG
jgi:tetrahydromethanopterin S-methyltransferase subunit G